jgi:hypothetical protein
MAGKRFEELAAALAARDRALPKLLSEARPAFEALRQRAVSGIDAFVRSARTNGAEHLTHVCVDEIGTDDRHVDCLQFRVTRGAWQIVCVGRIRKGIVTLVGPFRSGKPERPCADHPLLGDAAGPALDDLLLELLREASGR